MFTDDYKAQLSLLDQQTLSLEAMLNRSETAGAQWHDIRAKVAVVRDCLRRIRDLHASTQGPYSQKELDTLEYETRMMNLRFDELLGILENRVELLQPTAFPTGPMN